MPDAKKPKPVKSVTKVAKTPASKQMVNKPAVEKTPKRKPSIKEQLERAKKEADAYSAERKISRKPNKNTEKEI